MTLIMRFWNWLGGILSAPRRLDEIERDNAEMRARLNQTSRAVLRLADGAAKEGKNADQ